MGRVVATKEKARATKDGINSAAHHPGPHNGNRQHPTPSPSPGPWRDDVKRASSQQSRTKGGQVTADRERKGSGTPTTTLYTATSRRGRPQRQGPDLDLHQAVKALGRLVIQQETSIKVLRQDTSWVIFVQPGPQSSLQLLFKVGQVWKDNQQKGAVNRPLRSVLITCLMEHLLKVLEDLKGPLLEKAQSQGWPGSQPRQGPSTPPKPTSLPPAKHHTTAEHDMATASDQHLAATTADATGTISATQG